MKQGIQYLIILIVILCSVLNAHAQTTTITIDGSTVITNDGHTKQIINIGDNYSSIDINENGIIIDGKSIVTFSQESKTINIVVNSNQKSIRATSASITVNGNVEYVNVTSGSVHAVNINEASATSGSITAETITTATTTSGKIIH